MTFQVFIQFGGNHSEEYVIANSAEEAIAKVRNSLPSNVARWAAVFA